MIWIDASFGVEWLLGTPRAAQVVLPREPLAILPAQFAEILAYFARRMGDLAPVMAQLEALNLEVATRRELMFAARLYHEARARRSKASLADAMLAAVARERKESLLAFDADFAELGLKGRRGVWMVS